MVLCGGEKGEGEGEEEGEEEEGGGGGGGGEEEEEAFLNEVCVVFKERTVAGCIHLTVKPVPQGESLLLVPLCATGT